MLNIIIPEDMLKHPERQDEIFKAIDDYFATDFCTKEEHRKKKRRLRKALKGEPRLRRMLRREHRRSWGIFYKM